MLKEWFDSYDCKSIDEEFEAKREILQHIVLAALSRSDFFDHASFYGGTALRILHGLPRYSEDIDFSLNGQEKEFSLANYFSFIEDECKMFGLEVALSVKDKVSPNAIESAFLKDNTEWNIITLQDKRDKMASNVKIKVEIDRNPPLLFKTEQKLILRPFSFYVTTFEKESLFAGKMHALLYREWKTRTKGRDWYDMEWYIKKGITLDLTHLQERAWQSGHLDKNETMTKEKLSSLLKDRISRLDVDGAYFDAKRFVHNPADLKIWSKQYFQDLGGMIKVKS
jgi:predicted nucleotidyltransferase component of viral defense system